MIIRILALCGGVGGAKLALGLSHVVPAEELAILVKTGDDFEHLGLNISPDVDTVTYTLAGISNTELGWGIAGESWAYMDQLRMLGGEDWFQLCGRDLALHVERTRRMAAGESLSAVTSDVARKLGVGPTILPMSDDPVRTMIDTDEGLLSFQHYCVSRRAQPTVQSVDYRGADTARPNAAALAMLASPVLEAVIICPYNPWLSIAPPLPMPGLRDAIVATAAPVIAFSPIVSGQASKGPTTKLMTELGHPVTAATVAQYYGDLLDGYVLDIADGALATDVSREGLTGDVCQTVMKDLDGRIALADSALNFAQRLRRETPAPCPGL